MNLRSLTNALRPPISLLRRNPAQLLAVLGLMVGASLLEGLGSLLLLSVLATIGVPAGETDLGTLAVEGTAVLGQEAALPIVLAALVSIAAVGGLLRFHERIMGATIVESTRSDLRNKLFRAVAKADWPFHLRHRHSRLIRTSDEEIGRVGESLRLTLDLLSGALSVTAFFVVALILSVPATGTAVLIASVGLWLLRRGRGRRRGTGSGKALVPGAMERTVVRFLGGLKTAKSQADEDSYISSFESTSRSHSAAWVRGMKVKAEAGSVGGTTVLVGSAFLGWLAIGPLGVPAASVIVLLYVGARMAPRIKGFRDDLTELVETAAVGEQFEELIDEAIAAQEPVTWHGAPTPPLREGIRLERVAFRTDSKNTDTPEILDISMEIPAYRITALIGAPGGGTSTIGDVLGGLIIPQSGQVLVDGRPLSGGDYRGWRRRIGYVSPDAFMPEGTLRTILGAPHGSERDAELRNALRIVQLDAMVQSFPNGLDTVIGEGGRTLRDGDRLRLAFARALLRRPQLLILDEGIRKVDRSDDTSIRRALSTLRGRVTVLIVSHRLSLVREADLIHVIEAGNLAESGTWTELRETGERFKAIIAAEAGRERRRATELAGPPAPSPAHADGPPRHRSPRATDQDSAVGTPDPRGFAAS